jgi:hypothetical protein
VSYIGKRETAELPLLADFSPDVLNLTENSRIPGELVIRYELLGQEKTAIRSAEVSVYNRNTFRWTDAAGLAAFVSPTSPETLEFAKQLTGLARPRLRTGMNRGLQFAMYLFEGIISAGIGYSPTVSTPYEKFRRNADILDSVQFPFQTLAYRTGDLVDLGLLFAALLEASGIRAAIIPLDDDFIVAFSPGLTARGAASHFNGTANILIVNDEAWIPLSFASLKEGFMGSWDAARKKLDAVFASGAEADFIILEDAWQTYPPANLLPQNLPPAQPAPAAVAKQAEAAVKGYIAREIEPAIQGLAAQIRGGSSAGQLNQLGLLYLRSGSNAQARASFERAAGMNFLPAMLNLGNLALLEKDSVSAERWFKRVLALDADNAAAKKGLAQIAFEKN